MYSGGINSSWFTQFHDLQGRGHLSIASVSLLGGNYQNYGNEDELHYTSVQGEHAEHPGS